ncbi:MAG: hypothetical protein V3R16_02510 [Nitrospirales bacterium]
MATKPVHVILEESKSDFVEVHKLSDETRRAWGIGDVSFMPEPEAAWLFFRLREILDSQERFPKGKWASIQALEDLIKEQAVKAVT